MQETPMWIAKNQQRSHSEALYKQALEWQEYAESLQIKLDEQDDENRFVVTTLFAVLLIFVVVMALFAAIVVL